MKYNLLAPSVGESVTEVSILKWVRQQGDSVQAGELVLEIESDKATVEVIAEFSGTLAILKKEGDRVPIGTLLGTIDSSATAAAAPSAPAKKPVAVNTPAPVVQAGPAARKWIQEHPEQSIPSVGTGKHGRLVKSDLVTPPPSVSPQVEAPPVVTHPGERRVPLSGIRIRIAERLLHAQQSAAILTTFNEVNMSAVIALRNQHKESFKAKHGVALSFMSFFTFAALEALKAVPEVNASMDGRDAVYHDYYDIGIAVGTDRGLVVPVVRHIETLNFIELEKKIAGLALKAREGKLSIQDLSGGTFTISNGGVYGSLLSTPILNPPQSGILGMHKTQDRPIAVNGKIEICPMMYLALSYDHRLIDGKGAVTFLVTLKEWIEHPEKLKLEL